MEKKKKLSEKSKYDMNLRKKLEKKQFNTDLSKTDYEELNDLLNNFELSKALFVRVSKNNLKKGMLKMKTCDEIKDYLKNKKIKIKNEEREDFELGNYSAQSEEDTIELEDGYLFYIVNADVTKCHIDIDKRTDPNDVDDKFIDDSFFDGYFTYNTLCKLLDLIK